ncbi:mycothiol conjugate amidase Mca [Kineosporia rhizophila]|uniref:mycothiol conjugate amidase Mca n=1 Tax=Kineosporia TaxID=49184 RepID=UPI001E290F64|nr:MULTISPECIES: mycothiol conjugate amidase Mca [Kineosporia]MCE0535032.1 mycothiol conjugate amidase Mca [Kineosporia rhizophila]GLY14684.1 mycothiol S-conjugate amidase [Kineosporia sp. NBRC 101677]
MAEQLRLMAVHAHPDDESSKGAATLARYVDEGVDVLVVSCTGGERGDVLNPKLQGDPEVERDLPELRRKEMANAAAALGVRHHWLGFVDSGLPEGDPLPPLPEGCFALQPLEVASAPLVRLVREFRPHVITTYNELGGYPHPDHIMTHKVSVEAFESAGDPTRYPDSGEPWTPLKLYYDVGFSYGRMMAFHEALLAQGKESPFAEWLKARDEGNRPPDRKITTQVNIVGWMERRDQALRSHATQIDPDGWFFAIPNDVQAEVWPTDDFELARSLVESELPEDDLFAGIRDRAKV